MLFAGLAFFRTRRQSAIEILALRHQLGMLKRSVKRPRLTNVDRGLWVLLSRRWGGWSDALIIVKPAAVVRWHRAGFRRYWAWRCRTKGGRPAIDPEVRKLIKQMANANMWGAPRIHGELLKLGIHISEATVSKYLPRRRKPPSQTWRSFLENHVGSLVSVDFFHVIVLNKQHLRQLLRRFVSEYYHPCRTHLSLGKDSPEPRAVEPPEMGEVIELPLVGGLHHRYTRRAA